MSITRNLKRGNVDQFDLSYQLGFKSIWASELDADFNTLFGSVNGGPIGPAGGDLTGTYPDPTIAPLAVTSAKLAANAVINTKILDATIELPKLASSITDLFPPPFGVPEAGMGLAVDPTGTFLQWIVGGFSGVPAGPAGGDLAGTYPNPTLSPAILARLPPTFGAPESLYALRVNSLGTLLEWVTVVGPGGILGAAGGDLLGSYPNPTVAKINTKDLGDCTPTNRNHLVGTGTLWQTEPYPAGVFSDAVLKNLRIEPTATWQSQVRVRADGLGLPYGYREFIDLTFDLATSGALGLDTGVEAANTWYAIWVAMEIPSGLTSGVLSTSFTFGGLTIPPALASYTLWRRVGAVRNNATSNLYRMRQYDRRVIYDQPSADLKVLNFGTSLAIADVDCSEFVPTTARLAHLQFNIDRTNAAPQASLYHGDTVDTTNATIFLTGSASASSRNEETITPTMAVSATQRVRYKVATAGTEASLWVLGYEDPI